MFNLGLLLFVLGSSNPIRFNLYIMFIEILPLWICGLDDMVFGMIIAGAVSAVASIVNTSKTNKSNRRNVESTNQTNRELQQEANDFNLEMWEKNNEYNSPSNQIKLLQDAGLNPLAFYGGGDATSTALTSAPVADMQAFQAMPYDLNPISTGINSALDAQRVANETQLKDIEIQEKQANTELAKANKSFVEAQCKTEKSKQDNLVAQTDLVNKEVANFETTLKLRLSEIGKNKAAQAVDFANSSYTKQLERIAKKKCDYEIRNLIDNSTMLRELARKYKLEGNNLHQLFFGICNDNVLKGKEISLADLQIQLEEIGVKVREAEATLEGEEWYQILNGVVGLIGDLTGAIASGVLGAVAGSKLKQPKSPKPIGFGR